MKKLLTLIILSFTFFLSPYVSFSVTSNIIHAASNIDPPAPTQGASARGSSNSGASSSNKDYVDGDYATSMDKAKGATKDMNAGGHVSSNKTYDLLDTVRRVQPVTGLTTNASLNDPETRNAFIQLYNESLAGQANTTLAYFYNNPPANTYAFVEDLGQSLGFIPKRAYAQGIGFTKLGGFLEMWKAFRNIAYLLLAVCTIIIGLLIMFRKKIDPKTVITVQNALPNIIITLLLITFSYAIVGVLIDFMYVTIALAISVLKPISNGIISDHTYEGFLSGSFYVVIKNFMTIGQLGIAEATGLRALLQSLGQTISSPSTPFLEKVGLSMFYSGAGIVASAGTAIVAFILDILYIIAIIRVFFILVSAYIQIIMSLLISPFQLLLGVFPGSNAFENWIKNLIANLAAFPIVAIMIIIGGIIVVQSRTHPGTVWVPPMLGADDTANFTVSGIITIGILLAIPSVVKSVKDALKAKSAVGMGGIGGAAGIISTGTAVGQQLFSYAMSKNQMENAMRNTRGWQDPHQNKPAEGGKNG